MGGVIRLAEQSNICDVMCIGKMTLIVGLGMTASEKSVLPVR